MKNRNYSHVQALLAEFEAMPASGEKNASWNPAFYHQGSRYATQAYFELTQTFGITPAMSRREKPYDNAVEEISSL